MKPQEEAKKNISQCLAMNPKIRPLVESLQTYPEIVVLYAGQSGLGIDAHSPYVVFEGPNHVIAPIARKLRAALDNKQRAFYFMWDLTGWFTDESEYLRFRIDAPSLNSMGLILNIWYFVLRRSYVTRDLALLAEIVK